MQAEGRDEASAAVDQPLVTEGTWVRPGGVVLERTFAQAPGGTVGDPVTLNSRSFRVAGLAVTAAVPEPGRVFLPELYTSAALPGWLHAEPQAEPPGGRAMTTWQRIQNADNDPVFIAQQVLTPAVSSGGPVAIPATSCLAAVVLGTLAAVALLTAIPAGPGARRPAVPVLRAGAA